MSFISVQPNVNQMIDDVIRHISFDDMELDGEAGFGDVAGSSLDSYALSHYESFKVNDLDLYLNLTLDLNVLQLKTFLALEWLSKEIHVTLAHLKKKRTRLRSYTKSLEDFCKQ
ncbi:hypothetical protein Tco_1245768 [Tanacetum coccineum]